MQEEARRAQVAAHAREQQQLAERQAAHAAALLAQQEKDEIDMLRRQLADAADDDLLDPNADAAHLSVDELSCIVDVFEQ